MSARHTLYITLQYLRTVDDENRYHWGLWATDSQPPAGHVFHAIDTGRQALDLCFEARRVSNPTRSNTMVACLKIANAPSVEALKQFASQIPLMNPEYLPRGEKQWTSRAWVKATLKVLHQNRQIDLPVDVDTIEWYCQATADYYISRMGSPKIVNDLKWLAKTPKSARSGSQKFYGPFAMETEFFPQVD